MATHIGDTALKSMVAKEEEKPALVTTLRYTEAQLPNLRPVQDEIHAANADIHALTSSEKSVVPGSEFSKAQAILVTEEDDNDQDLPHNIPEVQAGEAAEQAQMEMPLKKKKKKRSSKKNRKSKATGFEEYYADPPITPAEYEEEFHDIYHHSRSFIERIQQCIQRYRARRNLDSERAHYFSVYLALGGVETGVKAFTGRLGEDMIEGNTAQEIEQIHATDHIRGGNVKFYDPSNAEHWVVDWEGIVKGFLSSRAPSKWTIEPYYLNGYCGVIRNFLNYVLSHSVCPEYTKEILAARSICDLALKEWPLITELYQILPGRFNKAAKTLYGGFDDWPVAETYWDDPENVRCAGRLPIDEAERIFKTTIAITGSDEQFNKMMGTSVEIISKEKRSMEVVEILLPTQKMKTVYAKAKDTSGEAGNVCAVGLLRAKTWVNPQDNEADASDDEGATQLSPAPITEVLWFEESILDKCFLGMKIYASLVELNLGIKYVDQILGLHPSFFTYLPMERLADYQAPVYSTRPGPTVDDANVAEGNEEYSD